jgi:hypothetical protein
MRKWIGAIIVLVVFAGVAAAVIKLITDSSTADLGPCRTAPASDTQPTYVSALGTISAESEGGQTLIADISLQPFGEASDNPENEAVWVQRKTAEILRCS